MFLWLPCFPQGSIQVLSVQASKHLQDLPQVNGPCLIVLRELLFLGMLSYYYSFYIYLLKWELILCSQSAPEYQTSAASVLPVPFGKNAELYKFVWKFIHQFKSQWKFLRACIQAWMKGMMFGNQLCVIWIEWWRGGTTDLHEATPKDAWACMLGYIEGVWCKFRVDGGLNMAS